jgi:hypothetical protein
MTKYISGILIVIIIIAFSCRKVDDTPPIINMNPPDSLKHILNDPYSDPGATATDEADGNITNNIYITNNVDVDKVGEYTVVYNVVDKQGNEAAPATRWVFVYNQAWNFAGYYNVNETQVFPSTESKEFESKITADSTVNYRIRFSNFGGDTNKIVYGDIYDTVIIIPFQIVGIDTASVVIQGSGSINDSIISLQYTKKDTVGTSLWNADFNRK